MKKTFFTVRPRLAALLMDAGIEWERTTNARDPDRPAWVFELNDVTAKVCKEFYNEIGAEVPLVIKAYEAAANEH